MSSHDNSYKCDNTFIVVVGNGLEKVVGFDFDMRTLVLRGNGGRGPHNKDKNKRTSMKD